MQIHLYTAQISRSKTARLEPGIERKEGRVWLLYNASTVPDLKLLYHFQSRNPELSMWSLGMLICEQPEVQSRCMKSDALAASSPPFITCPFLMGVGSSLSSPMPRLRRSASRCQTLLSTSLAEFSLFWASNFKEWPASHAATQ